MQKCTSCSYTGRFRGRHCPSCGAPLVTTVVSSHDTVIVTEAPKPKPKAKPKPKPKTKPRATRKKKS